MSSSNIDPRFLALLDEEDSNGAVESFLPEGTPLRVVIIGPIKTWWGRLDSAEFREYSQWRDAVRIALVRNGHLVYSPHRAWQGAWHESAQDINDAAIAGSHAVVELTPEGVLSVGTKAELEFAAQKNVPVIAAPPGGFEGIEALLRELQTLKK